jgi:hypothetical protein
VKGDLGLRGIMLLYGRVCVQRRRNLRAEGQPILLPRTRDKTLNENHDWTMSSTSVGA